MTPLVQGARVLGPLGRSHGKGREAESREALPNRVYDLLLLEGFCWKGRRVFVSKDRYYQASLPSQSPVVTLEQHAQLSSTPSGEHPGRRRA